MPRALANGSSSAAEGFAAPANVSDTPPSNLARLVASQLTDQLAGDTPLGKQLTRQLSAYFGEPIVLRVSAESDRGRPPEVSGTPTGPRQPSGH